MRRQVKGAKALQQLLERPEYRAATFLYFDDRQINAPEVETDAAGVAAWAKTVFGDSVYYCLTDIPDGRVLAEWSPPDPPHH